MQIISLLQVGSLSFIDDEEKQGADDSLFERLLSGPSSLDRSLID